MCVLCIDPVQVTEKCWNLRNLCLRGCLTVSDQTLNHIATNCSNLTALSLTYNKKITDNGIARLTAVCTGLQVRTKKNTPPSTPNTEKKQELDLSWCSRVSDSSLESIALHCPDLRELLVACCKLIRGTGIPHLAKHCGRLSHLVLRGCSNVEHLHLLSTSLTDLNLGNCLSLKEEVLATEIRCPSMVSLSLASVTTATDAAVESLLKANASVSKLELNFTNVVQPKMEGCSLRVLDLSSCQLLSLGMFQNLALHCTQLGELYLRGCKSVNDECVDHLTRAPQLGSGGGSSAPTGYRSNLRKIDLSRCESITDKAVSFIAARCSSLEYLDVSWCTRLTDASLRHLGQAATRFCCLEHVKIFGCTSMSSQAIQSLQHISSLHLHCIMVRSSLPLN